MAPVLQCPECGTKHPLDAIGIRSAFPCGGCGRTLKVPEQARAIASPPTSRPWPPVPDPSSALPDAAPDPIADPHATRAFSTIPPVDRAEPLPPPVTPPPLGPTGVPVPEPARVPHNLDGVIPGRWVRFGLWIVAVPLAFIVVFALARAFGVLSTNDVTDVALAEGWHRFVPIARLLPFVALATALFVHGSVYGIAQLRERRAATSAGSAGRTSRSPRSPRSPRPSGSGTGRQSSRTRT